MESAPELLNVGEPLAGPLFSICTLVTRHAEYKGMVESFIAQGFTGDNSEFLYLDNAARHRWDAFQGIRRFLTRARGAYVLLCHQDIRLLGDGFQKLRECLAALDGLDPEWALAGNAGATQEGALVIRISDPHGEDQRRGAFPARVVSLDENFIIIRRDALVGISAGLAGFHLYGTDMCLQARCAGRSAWVIDFHLRHLSAGKVDASFHQVQRALESQYDQTFRHFPWRIRTTCTRLVLGGGRLKRWFFRRAWRRGPG